MFRAPKGMKKKPEPKPPLPTDLEEFKARYGNDWQLITRSPAFLAGIQLLNLRKFKGITNLSDDQIERNGREILGDLRGHLKYENDLLTLHDQRNFEFPIEEAEEYASPEQVAEMQQLIEKHREQRKKTYYAT